MGGQDHISQKYCEGGTNRSYGIQVARLAGVPEGVIVRAKEILENLEKGELDEVGMRKIARGKKPDIREKTRQLNLFWDDEDHIINELKKIDVSNMTPLEAMNRINQWQTKLKGGK